MTITQRQLKHTTYLDWIIQAHENRAADTFEFDDHEFTVSKEVFNPNIATSSQFFAKEILQLDLKGKHVLDAGCGSGILSIAALKAGAAFAYAFDCNPNAVACTRQNLSGLNDVGGISNVSCKNMLPDQSQAFDYLFCNPPFFTALENSSWEKAFTDPGMGLLAEVLENGSKVLKRGGKLLLAMGGSMKKEIIRNHLTQKDFSELSLRKLSSAPLLDVHLLTAKLMP